MKFSPEERGKWFINPLSHRRGENLVAYYRARFNPIRSIHAVKPVFNSTTPGDRRTSTFFPEKKSSKEIIPRFGYPSLRDRPHRWRSGGAAENRSEDSGPITGHVPATLLQVEPSNSITALKSRFSRALLITR